MFLNWLVTVFPREMGKGWRLVRADLFLWLTVAAGLGGAAIVGDFRAEPVPHGLGHLLAAFAALAVLLTAVWRFHAAAGNQRPPWRDLPRLLARRLVPMSAAWLLAAAVSAGLAVLAQAAVLIVLRDTQAMLPVSWALRTVVYWSILVRFCFVPQLATLNRRTDFDPDKAPGLKWPSPFPQLLWPLMTSARMSDGLRWRLVAYLALALEAPTAVLLLPQALRLPLVIALQLVSFTAVAVLYDWYEKRLGAVVPTSPRANPSGPQ